MDRAEVLFYTSFPTAIGDVYLVWGPKGLLLTDLSPTSERSFLRAMKRRFSTSMVRDDISNEAIQIALQRYFGGQREVFKGIRLDLGGGTPFERSVWRVVRRIPYGQTRTYGDIARAIDRPTAARAVGRACGRNPLPPIIPCHRVLGFDGKLVGYSGRGGISMKKRLLEIEAGTLARGG